MHTGGADVDFGYSRHGTAPGLAGGLTGFGEGYIPGRGTPSSAQKSAVELTAATQAAVRLQQLGAPDSAAPVAAAEWAPRLPPVPLSQSFALRAPTPVGSSRAFTEGGGSQGARGARQQQPSPLLVSDNLFTLSRPERAPSIAAADSPMTEKDAGARIEAGAAGALGAAATQAAPPLTRPDQQPSPSRPSQAELTSNMATPSATTALINT